MLEQQEAPINNGDTFGLVHYGPMKFPRTLKVLHCMQPELQMIISVLTAGQPEEVNENYLCRKLGLSPAAFRAQYRSYAQLLKACTHYSVFLLQTELEIIWQLSVNVIQKLYYSLVALQRPENRKRRAYLQLVDEQFPLLIAEVRPLISSSIQTHFQQLLLKGKADGLILPDTKVSATANRLWYINGVALERSLQANERQYWLEEVVHVLWPLVGQLFTAAGHKAMDVSLSTYPQTLNQYSK